MIALVWNCEVRLIDSTIRYELYVDGFHTLGEEALTFCRAGAEIGYPYPTTTVEGEKEFHDPEFWRKSGCRAVVIITWHRMTNILQAIRAANLPVLTIGDSDAQISPRYHPWSTFRFSVYQQPTLRGKLGAAKQWARCLIFKADEQNHALVENLHASNSFTLAGQGAVNEYRRLICKLGASNLIGRVAWLPYPAPESFCTHAINHDRAARIIAIGRWNSAQKNPGLLAATVQRLQKNGDRTEILIVGNGSKENFSKLARTNRQVHALGIQSRDQIRELMVNSRSLLIPSRWESGPVVASEILALGGTVVGTPIQNMAPMTDNFRFGCVSRFHTPRALSKAIQTEMAAWDQGKRDPIFIASHWRALVSPTAVARRMLELLGLQPMKVPIVSIELVT